MALDASTIKSKAKGILYGTGLGEKPSMVKVAASDGAVVSGDSITFDLASGYGSKIRAGDVLSLYGSTAASSAYAFYAVDVSTDQVTAINGYEDGAAAAAGDISGKFLEVMPLVTEAQIYNAIDVVIATLLWPEIFDIKQDTVTPDLTSGQVALDTDDEEILAAFQKVGTITYPISFHLEKDMDTSLFSTSKMGSFDFIDASTTYYAAKRRVSLTNSTSSASLERLIAMGAAATVLGSTHIESTLDASKKDSQKRAELDVSAKIWREFLTLKQTYAEDLSRDTVTHFIIERN